MTDEIRDRVAAFFQQYPKRVYTKGQIIAHAGEELEGVLYLVEGRVNQYDIAVNGSEVVVNVFKPPAFFPMSWAINKTPNQYFFKAATRAVAHLAPAEEAVAFLKREPEVTFDLLARVYRGTDGLLRRLAHIMGGDARSRLIFEILVTAHRFSQDDADGAWRIPLKEGELATQTGLTRETVNRVIRDLKAEGLVQVTGAKLVVPDIMRLQEELGTDL
ncbi:Crp/Fnr family transcriptional regulator [Candidatus Saccharibacteria bacterium]|nr:Crp/Fnr family transcriptional regulator [Candidatus Saccharibacteria bacterium]